MKIRIKAILSVTVGFLAVLLTIHSLNRWIVQPAFEKLEKTQAIEDNARASAAIQSELHQLDQKVADWAEWDDAYAFAANPDPEFI